eukprot:ctg_900.g378
MDRAWSAQDAANDGAVAGAGGGRVGCGIGRCTALSSVARSVAKACCEGSMNLAGQFMKMPGDYGPFTGKKIPWVGALQRAQRSSSVPSSLSAVERDACRSAHVSQNRCPHNVSTGCTAGATPHKRQMVAGDGDRGAGGAGALNLSSAADQSLPWKARSCKNLHASPYLQRPVSTNSLHSPGS